MLYADLRSDSARGALVIAGDHDRLYPERIKLGYRIGRMGTYRVRNGYRRFKHSVLRKADDRLALVLKLRNGGGNAFRYPFRFAHGYLSALDNAFDAVAGA